MKHSVLGFIESFLSATEANALLATLEKLPWTRGTTRWGHPVPRDEVWMGPYPYKFSGRTLNPVSWTPEIEALRDRMQAGYGGEYNSVLLNRYRNGNDGVGWHADKEKEMDPTHPIASVSLGASRDFYLWAIDGGEPPQGPREIANAIATQKIQTFLLSSGSLLIMPAGFQQSYKHSVPKMKMPTGERINLTFRRMLS